jgi:hypothetical protein
MTIFALASCKLGRAFRRLVACFVFLTTHVAEAQTTPDIFLYLDWRMSAGPTSRLNCSETWQPPCAGNPPVYWQWEDTFDTGVTKAKQDYLPSGGYSKNLGDPDQTVQICQGAAFIESRPQYVTWCCPSTPWIANLTVRHSCITRDRWGRTSGPFNVENYVIFNGYCETGYQPSSDYRQCTRKDGWCAKYSENRDFGCGKTVADLEAVTKAADDPTRVFHQTQTCIARKSCDLRCRMDNCKWMDRVIPDFVNPYLQKTGNWSALESVCQLVKLNYRSYGAPIVGDLLCAEAMAEYHIEVDLVAAMTATGCGSDNDWNLVYQQIQTCSGDTQTALLGGWPDAAKNAGADYAAWKVRKLRDQARAQCVANRTAAGLDPEMNPAEKGKVCLQP